MPTEDGRNIYARFREKANSDPAAVAVIIDDKRWSYGELATLVARCATGLRDRGCKPGDAIAIALPNNLDFVVAAFAAFALSAVLVPLNPRFKEDELRHYLVLSRPKAIVNPPALDPVITSVDAVIPIRAHSTADLSAPEAAEGFPLPSAGAVTGVYMFSSGSTGKSKRITRTQGQVLDEYEALERTIQLSPRDRILCTVPLFHAHGFGNAMLAALLSGGSVVILTAEFNARATMQALVREEVTVYPAVPFMFKMLSETKFSTAPSLSNARLLFSAGAALPQAVSQRFFEQFGKPVSQLFGSTETGAISINVDRALEKPTSVGLPLSGYALEIRGEDGVALGPRQNGEVWVRSSAATRSYDGLPEMTAECFAGDFFFTGDTGELDDDGYLYITGRKKLLINVAGYKVDPLEVEEVLTRHPDVADVVVIGVEHPGYGEKIKAAVVLRENGSCTQQQLIDYAASHLAEYKIPKVVEFRSEIPRSPLGKVLRKYL